MTAADVGKEIFRSGRTTGRTSGPIGWDEGNGPVSIGIVDGYGAIADLGGNRFMVYGFAAEMSVAGGDSGGAVMLDDKAVGVVSDGMAGTDEHPGMLWTAELAEGPKHLPDTYSIKTVESDQTDDPTPVPTATPTVAPTEDPVSPLPTEDADLNAEMFVDPSEIGAAQFVADGEAHAEAGSRGVPYTVTGAEPGSAVVFDTYASLDEARANAGSGAVTA